MNPLREEPPPPNVTTKALIDACQECLDDENLIVTVEDYKIVVRMVMSMARHVERFEETARRTAALNEMLLSDVERLGALHDAVALGGPINLKAFAAENVEKLGLEIAEFLQKVTREHQE
jgi:hypothetical protein